MLIKKRRKAIQYAEVDKIIDRNGKVLQIGDFISIFNENKTDGPITKIYHEITGSADKSIQKILYVDNNIYFLDNIKKFYKAKKI